MDRFDRIPFADLSAEASWLKLGQGSFGCVYQGEYLGLQVAIKEVLPSGEYDVDKYLEREVRLMQQARHPNIVQYLGLSLTPSSGSSQRILIISEFLPRGNLRQYILDSTLPMPWRLRLSFAIDLARAIAYMHARKCLHRDLKGENLLVTENLRVKVCDFGFARLAAANDEERRRMSYCGTDGYMSPEIIAGEEFDLPTDIFSLGVILAELLSRKIASNKTFIRQLPSFGIDPDEIRSSASSHCPESLIALTLQCLQVEPGLRPSAVKVLSALLQIEKEVKDAQERGDLGEERGGSWHAGSIGYAGWGRRANEGPQTRRRKDLARALPKWESEDESEDEVEALARLNDEAGSSLAALMDEPDPFAASAFASNVTVKGVERGATYRTDGMATLPRLPESWIQQLGSGSEGGEGFNESTIKAKNKSPRRTAGGGESFLTAFTSSVISTSTAGAVVGHDRLTSTESTSTEEDSPLGSTLTVLPSPAADHTKFYSAAESPSHSNSSLIPPVTHRFSLIKPSFQRFLGSLPVELASSNPKRGSFDGRKRLSVEQERRDSEESAKSVDLEKGFVMVSPRGGRERDVCGVCEKKFGLLKAHLECDDCALRCHIKCSDLPPRL